MHITYGVIWFWCTQTVGQHSVKPMNIVMRVSFRYRDSAILDA